MRVTMRVRLIKFKPEFVAGPRHKFNRALNEARKQIVLAGGVPIDVWRPQADRVDETYWQGIRAVWPEKKSWRDEAVERLDRACDPHTEVTSYGGIDRNPNPIWKNRYPWKSYNPITGITTEHHDADSFPGLIENDSFFPFTPIDLTRESGIGAQDERPTRPATTDTEPPKAGSDLDPAGKDSPDIGQILHPAYRPSERWKRR